MKRIFIIVSLLVMAVCATSCSKRCKCSHINQEGQVLTVTYHELSGVGAKCSSLDIADENYGDESNTTGVKRLCENAE